MTKKNPFQVNLTRSAVVFQVLQEKEWNCFPTLWHDCENNSTQIIYSTINVKKIEIKSWSVSNVKAFTCTCEQSKYSSDWSEMTDNKGTLCSCLHFLSNQKLSKIISNVEETSRMNLNIRSMLVYKMSNASWRNLFSWQWISTRRFLRSGNLMDWVLLLPIPHPSYPKHQAVFTAKSS